MAKETKIASDDNEVRSFDHRKIGKDLEIFFIDKRVGQGLPIILKNGTIIKNIIQEVVRSKEREYECEEVISPVLADSSLYKTSGHLDHYKDYIFPEIEKDREVFQLRPMTCPHHCMIYDRKVNSYRDLPIWISEHSILHRFEPSGSLRGLERARWMELSDNHVFTTKDSLKESFKKCFSFVSEIISYFGIKIESFVCSLHEKNNLKYYQDEKIWDISEKLLIDSLEELKVKFVKKVGEAAFYGPKLDIEVKNSDGKNVTISTIQIDFVIPQKFSLNYISKDGSKQHPIIIHHSPIGTYQRFISILLEYYKGKLPPWISPVQLVILLSSNKASEKVFNFCHSAKKQLKSKNFRVEFWENNKRLASNIKRVHELRIPFYFVVGEEEVNNKTLKLFSVYDNKQFCSSIDEIMILIEKKLVKSQ